MRFPGTIAFLSSLLVSGLAVAPLVAQDASERIVKQGVVKEDLYLAGSAVEVRAQVDGDVLAAGGTVTVDELVRGDVMAAGGTVEVRAAVSDDVRVFGGQVDIDGQVGDHAIAAGGTVTLGRDARVGGRAWLAGGTVRIGGRIGKDLKAAGDHIVIAGEIGGDAELAGERIEIAPGAVIRGQLRYMSPSEAQIDRTATIAGAITRVDVEPHAQRPPSAAGFRFGMFTALTVAAIVLVLLFPGFSVTAARTLQGTPWKSLGLGLALLATTPVVIVLLLVTIVGILLALTALALYPVLLLAGVLTGIIALSDLGLRWLNKTEAGRAWRVATIAITGFALWLVCLLPGVGALVMFALLLLGLGALTLSLWRRYSAAA